MTNIEDNISHCQKHFLPPLVNQQQNDLNEISIPQNYNSNNPIPFHFISPIFSYFNCNRVYLNRKYSDSNNINFKYSNNYILKDSLILNEDTKDKDNSLDEDINHQLTNENSQNFVEEEEYNDYSHSNNEEEYTQSFENPFINSNYPNQFNNNYIRERTYPIQRPRYNSEIFSYNQLLPIKLFKENSKQKGWICKFCNNFNYDTRKKCNRCLVEREKSELSHHNILNYRMSLNPNNFGFLSMNRMNLNGNFINKTNYTKKAKDWVCFNCKNLNFPFRIVCNRCKLPKEESDAHIKKNI